MIFEISDSILTVAKSIVNTRPKLCHSVWWFYRSDIDKYALTLFVSISETPRIDFPMYTENWFFGPKNQFSKFLKPFLPFAPDPIYKNPPVRSLQRSNKTFWDFKSKIRFLKVVGNVLEIFLTCYNMFLGQRLRPAWLFEKKMSFLAVKCAFA